MARQGAKHLIILSRRGETQSSRELLAKLRDAGCEAEIYSCDVADKAQLERALHQSMKIMPPIRGVIQAAMVLKVRSG
jgi:NAD(P)-dependent dehydrogenase (short-subunit alcohol dehydrogenase family)